MFTACATPGEGTSLVNSTNGLALSQSQSRRPMELPNSPPLNEAGRCHIKDSEWIMLWFQKFFPSDWRSAEGNSLVRNEDTFQFASFEYRTHFEPKKVYEDQTPTTDNSMHCIGTRHVIYWFSWSRFTQKIIWSESKLNAMALSFHSTCLGTTRCLRTPSTTSHFSSTGRTNGRNVFMDLKSRCVNGKRLEE